MIILFFNIGSKLKVESDYQLMAPFNHFNRHRGTYNLTFTKLQFNICHRLPYNYIKSQFAILKAILAGYS